MPVSASFSPCLSVFLPILGLSILQSGLLIPADCARLTFHPGSMAVVARVSQDITSQRGCDPEAALANPAGLARGREGAKAYCKKSQVKETVTVLE